MAGLARPMQHALNNLVMVMQANLDSVVASLPPDDRASIRLARAAQATGEMDALLRALTETTGAGTAAPPEPRSGSLARTAASGDA